VRLVTAVGRSAAGWFGGALLVALLGSIGSEVGPTSILTGSMRGHLFISNPIPLLQSSSTTVLYCSVLLDNWPR